MERVLDCARSIARLRVSLYAAHASFFLVLSMFPGLVLLVGLLRYTGLEIETLISLLEGFFPDVLVPVLKKVIRTTYFSTSGMTLSLSAVVSLWSAGRGVYGLIIGLNALYGVKESRGYFYTRVISTGYMFAFLVVLLLTLILSVFGGTLVQWLPLDAPIMAFIDDVVGLRFLLLLLLQTGLFSAMFMALPNRAGAFRDAFPGAVFASLGWLTFSKLYSVYVQHFSGIAGIYGPVYLIAIGMLWLYFCISIVFYGGALNRFLMEKRR